MHGAAQVPARVVALCPDGHVGHPVAVDVPDAGHRGAELVAVCKRGAVGRGRVYLGGLFDRAVRVHEEHVHRPPVRALARRVFGAHRHVLHAVPVDVPYARDRLAELAVGGQRRRAPKDARYL